MIRNEKDSYEQKERRITSLMLSLVIAFGLWWYVVNNVSVEDDITFNNIPVVREGESVLNERNLMITEISAESVSMNLMGSREDLNKVDSSNMSVKINLSNIEEPGERIPLQYIPSYPATVANTAFEVSHKNPSVIFVSVDHRRTFVPDLRICCMIRRTARWIIRPLPLRVRLLWRIRLNRHWLPST